LDQLGAGNGVGACIDPLPQLAAGAKGGKDTKNGEGGWNLGLVYFWNWNSVKDSSLGHFTPLE
jgi:hypothetical protein